ncbi:MAG: FecR domain-containing protein [Candidatus Pseudobacter hemicellulosilyticus]|uniref:FecR domain-containing protein n=1 Tax=Candidatus Pseudobacter hemicellulosilyticus TaxID=3121375 RepID=A0AAJ6BHY2_9BACT|nr:MAG: FecR domain-containing protein [Pseudobacter sp.]
MTHHDLQEAVKRYLSGQATDADLRLFEEWFRITEHGTDRLPAAHRAAVEARLLPRLSAIAGTAAARTGKKALHRISRYWVRVAALVVGLMATAVTGYYFRSRLLDFIDPVKQQTMAAGMYETKQLILPDSTIVILNAGASISYPDHFRDDKRQLTLQGEAFFAVAPLAGKPFIVQTSTVAVQVLGTSFLVNDGPASAGVSVSVLTGKVRVNKAHQQLGILTPGKQLLLDKGTGIATLRNADLALAAAWTNNLFAFHETPLKEVFSNIQRRFQVQIITTEGITDKLFTGTFSNKDSLDDILLALELSTGVHVKKIGHKTIDIR